MATHLRPRELAARPVDLAPCIAQNVAADVLRRHHRRRFHTEDIAERLKVLLPGSELKDLDRMDFVKELEESEALICCTPTWNTGSETKRSGTK